MTKEDENPKNENNSIIQGLTTKEAFQKGLSIGLKKGRLEGALIYQKRIIQNMETDNVTINRQLEELKKSDEFNF